MRQRIVSLLAVGAVMVGSLAAGTAPASANHSWGGYHWARTSNPFTVKLGNNLSGTWPSYLATTSSDWSESTVLDTTVVVGQTNPKRCGATAGRVEVCNSTYGRNGWLGLATVWVSGTHITQGTTKLNDTYFNTATYNTPAWRNLVMCQEVGHTFGLAHQDENHNNTNLGSCMDYTSDPAGKGPLGPLDNENPNAHDFEQLVAIYGHADPNTTLAATASSGNPNTPAGLDAEPGDDPSTWGQPVKVDGTGRPIVFERDLGNGQRRFTFVVWTPDARQGEARASHEAH